MNILRYYHLRVGRRQARRRTRRAGRAILLVKPLPPDEFELGYRAAMARPDPDWHWEQAQKYEKEKSWFAAPFHCEQVLKSRPDDAAAKKVLEAARAELKK